MQARSDAEREGLLNQLVVGLLAVALIGGAVYLGVLEARRERRFDGTHAPAFSLEKYGGGTVSLEDQRGKVVMLDFWATWCAPCVEEMPTLVKLAQELEPKGLVFVAANRDEASEQKAAVGVFVARQVPELGRHVAFADDATTARYGVEALPTLYVIDREGKVIESRIGSISESKLRRLLEAALSR